jgi:hypothetical protein
MVRNLMAKPHVRFAADALAGFALFSGLTVALLGPTQAADLVAIGQTVSGVSTMPLLTTQAAGAAAFASQAQLILLVLALVFSTLFALNLAFVRHLAKSYVAVRAHRANHRDDAAG